MNTSSLTSRITGQRVLFVLFLRWIATRFVCSCQAAFHIPSSTLSYSSFRPTSRIGPTGRSHNHDSNKPIIVGARRRLAAHHIAGLLEDNDFDRLQTTHDTLLQLRNDIPLLLYQPYTEETAATCFTRETEIRVAAAATTTTTTTTTTATSVDEKSIRQGGGGSSVTTTSASTTTNQNAVLASSREEMIALQNTLLLAVQAPLRATNLISRQKLTAPIIRCNFIIDVPPPPNATTDVSQVWVEWSVPGALSNTNFSGVSELRLVDGKVNLHLLKQVQWNGQRQDAEAIGAALARIRQTLRSLQSQPSQAIIQSTILPPLGAMLSQYRNDLIRQLDIVVPSSQDTMAPISVRTSSTAGTKNETHSDQMSLPAIPGTPEWTTYAQAHVAIQCFVNDIIPKLALGPPLDAPFDMEGLFLPDAKMVALDGTELIPSGRRLAKFYQSLASWRRRSLTTWTLVEARVREWQCRNSNTNSNSPLQVEISYVIDLPGSDASSPLTGVDCYTLQVNQDSDAIIRIQSVHQKSMSIGGNSNTRDLVLFMRGLVAAVENDRFINADERWITDLWQRLRAPSNGRSEKASLAVDEKKNRQQLTPSRSDAAAATVYRIMVALHNGGRELVDLFAGANNPPALDFMIENVELRGLLNESLLRGRSSYQQSLGISIGSLRSSLRTKRLIREKEPLTVVELTKSGNIRFKLTLFLRIEAFAGLYNLLNIPSAGLPLQVDLVSDYILDPDSGRIIQHRLVESRINGQLTPGDILSRVLLRRGKEGSSLDDSAWGRTITEVLSRLTNLPSS